MKGKITSVKIENKFKPFILELEIETLQEARLLYHLANAPHLLDVFKKGVGGGCYGLRDYSDDIAESFHGYIWELISDEIKKQGFTM